MESVVNSLLVIAFWLHESSARWPWVSWIIHAAMAIPVAIVGAVLYLVGLYVGMPPLVAAGLSSVTSFYLWRELEQVTHRKLGDKALSPVDHIMDVLAPILAVLLAWWVVG